MQRVVNVRRGFTTAHDQLSFCEFRGTPMLKRLTIACIAVAVLAGSANAKPPMEAFGDVPEIRAVELSPDGNRVAFLQRIGDTDVLVIHDFKAATAQALTKLTDIRARDVHFVGNEYVVLIVSKDTHTYGFRGRYEYSAAFAFNVNTGKYVQLLRNTKDIFPAQSGLGIIVGVAPNGKDAFMPAYMGSAYEDPSRDLLRVPLENGRGLRDGGARGTTDTIDWLMNRSGQTIAREQFDEKDETHLIQRRESNGSWKNIYEKKTPLPEIGLVGVSSDGQSLVVIDDRESEFLSLYNISISDGTISPPLMQRDDASVAATVSDINRIVYGVRYSGMFPSYDMFDAAIEAEIKAVQQMFPDSAVYLDSWSDDWSKMLFFVEGGTRTEQFTLYDRTAKKLTRIVTSRPAIKQEDVGEVITIEYKARDGLKIPALITWPTGVAVADRKKLPLIVMPHGGPEAYDAVGFDWLAQFLANEGYAVLQPNFRGSAGFGSTFVQAGYGEWGRKMQDDITDGATAMVKMGWADPDRMCIVGWSYGGYAALAGGALTPDLYKCVAAIAGVSDLREMLSVEKREHGEHSRALRYWELLIGDAQKDKEAIDAVSPAKLAANFKAPVLLVHGAADRIVPIRQSELMHDALRNAKKNVKYISIPGDDHGLIDNDSRRQMLTALGEFIAANIGR